MSLNAKNIPDSGNSNRVEQPPLENGTYPARIVQIVSLGSHSQEYMGEEKPPKTLLNITYELSDEFMVDEEGNEIENKPLWISERFPLNSLNSDLATSTKRYYAIDPNEEHGGDWASLIGMPVVVTLVQNPGKGKNKDRIFNNVKGVSTMRAKDASKLPELVHEPKVFDFEEPDLEVFLSLTNYTQDLIKESLDFKGSTLESLLEGHKDGPKGGSSQDKPKASEEASESVSDTSVDEDEDW